MLTGAGDDYPENSFYMTGSLQDAFEKGRMLAANAAK